ncbi:MAG: ATP-dependent helicase [Microbacteriaceae bacterium]|nr:ATP-dependent helicase [Microbacteriaceae bacterium]
MIGSAEEILAALDPQQRAAAEALVGPVCILAGAGTGKTRTITHRIAYGIATGRYAGPRTMALTFTTRAAGELRQRLRALGAGEVQARTFHSAALAQLSYFWPRIVGGTLPRIVDSKASIIADAAAEAGVRADTATIRDLAAEIEWRKVSDLSIEEWAAAGRAVAGVGIGQVAAVQRAYEELKDERRQMDLEDVLLATAGMIASEPAVARSVREQYRTFVVDEYQDVSPIQHRLLRLWLGERRDVCVVGDVNQTIYSFAGASAMHLLGFEREFAGAEVVRLERSHRSAQPILDLANRLVAGRAGALRLVAAGVGGDASTRPAASLSDPDVADRLPERAGGELDWLPERAGGESGWLPERAGGESKGVLAPSLSVHADDRAEARAVASAVRADLDGGVEPQRIAVLVRLGAQVPVVEDALRDARIPVNVRGNARFFEQPHVREAIVHLVAARRAASATDPAVVTARGVLAGLGWSEQPPAVPGPALERWTGLDALHRLAADAGPTAFARFVDELLERQAANDDPVAGAVTISTIHAAKGLEWESVHVIGLSEGLLPISYAMTPAEVEEERRLLYVAITRAKRRLHLSRARRGGAGVGAAERAPSRFLADLPL